MKIAALIRNFERRSARLPRPQLRTDSVSFDIVKYDSARTFLARASGWLLKAEADNNLILSIARRSDASDEADDDSLFATIESEGYIVGCLFRTPPYKLGLTRGPLKAIPVLAEAVGEQYETLPGVLGPREEARYFARTWCGPRALSFRPVMDQRIYALEELVEPDSWPAGSLRMATESDYELIIDWLRHFFEETRMPVRNAEDIASRLVPAGEMSLWIADGVEVSMAGITGRTPHGARIGFVYTPPDYRKRGYATAVTAALTRSVLAEGRLRCYLFTDASNPTSNRIYQNLG